jgi:hypothetical protein
MESLACIDHFDFDDPAFAATHCVDGMHADRTIIDKPRHHQLSHWLHPFSVARRKHTCQGDWATHCYFGLDQHGFSHGNPMSKDAL